MLRQAFKDWAVICEALRAGQQSLVLRKGGIHEGPDGFRVEHERFWLLPTYVHQQDAGIVPAAQPLLERVRREKPPVGIIRLQLHAEVAAVFQVKELEQALGLEGQHIWSAETVRMRFNYRQPGLYVLAVRVFALSAPVEVANTPYYEGCKSWVELERAISTEPARPVLGEVEFAEAMAKVRGALNC